MFEALTEWFERRRALRELRAGEGQGNKAYSAYFTEQIAVAKSDFHGGREKRALEVWRLLYASYPDLCLKSEPAFNLLIDLGRHDEADALLREARGRYPRHKSLYATIFARVAYRRGDLEEALRRYEAVRREFPDVADGYGMAAACLSDLGLPAEAEAMLESGIRKLPNNFDLCMRYAQAATQRLDLPVALERWNILSTRFEHLPGPLGVADCLKRMGRMAEAEKILRDTCERFEGNPYPFVAMAELAAHNGDFEEAARRWEIVRYRFSSFERAYTGGAEALRSAGHEAEADELLRVIVLRSPAFLNGHLEYARSAHRRGDWSAAAERWALVRERFPDCAEAREREAEALAAKATQGSAVPP